jgi:hypothetical protein
MTKFFLRIIGSLLSPFVKVIRYGALKLMKRVRAPGDHGAMAGEFAGDFKTREWYS